MDHLLRLSFFERLKYQLKNLPATFTVSLLLIVTIGFLLLFDAAKGDFFLYTYPQIIKFILGFFAALIIGLIDVRVIYKYSYVMFFVSICLLALVPIVGDMGKGAQRWLDLGFLKFQPSELVKITLILALAKFYHKVNMNNISKFKSIFAALSIIAVPSVLTLIQPDLGTSLLIIMIGLSIMFACGVSKWFFGTIIALGVVAVPIFWNFVMYDYQKKRVLTFLNPESDPLGAGYHIIQSKIAIGSAGFFGKGFMQGTQSHLAFLPEKHTDFIFALLAEDFGMFGSMCLIICYIILILSCVKIAMNNRNHYSSLVAIGVGVCIFLYAFINMAMVTGLMPVVGVPLPFVSYGGTSMLTLMIAVGLVFNAAIQKEEKLPSETRF
ncbi:MAG TPA: rod shape-determining protein RodA [Alphaproteobacteria bacterium]|nr:rod shape-determining protein RodA [Alphaproteobacteria bacterium]